MDEAPKVYCPVGGKIRYETPWQARRALNQTRKGKRRKGDRREKRVYACNECQGWHLTSKQFSDESVAHPKKKPYERKRERRKRFG